jgi:hypothetical protein
MAQSSTRKKAKTKRRKAQGDFLMFSERTSGIVYTLGKLSDEESAIYSFPTQQGIGLRAEWQGKSLPTGYPFPIWKTSWTRALPLNGS